MQGLTADPRSGLTDEQVNALLTGPAVTVSAGLERLSSSLVVQEDLSDDLVDGSVERVMDARIHGTVKLTITRALDWGTTLVRPYMTLTDGVVSARFNCGVYTLTTPTRAIGETPETYDVTGYDRLYLLNRPVGDAYSVAAGTGYLAAVRSALTAAGVSGVLLDGTAEASTLPASRVWTLMETGTDGKADSGGMTWLQIINELLEAVNYRALWTDENGLYRSGPYAVPSTRPVEYAFDADAVYTIVGEDRTVTEDQWRTPNRWIFLQRNTTAAPVEGAGIYTVNNVSDGPTSQNARGQVWAAIHEYDAADQAALVSLGDRRVAADRRLTAQLQVTTGPFPLAGHADVFTYADAALGATRKVQAERWAYSLTGGDVQWTWETV